MENIRSKTMSEDPFEIREFALSRLTFKTFPVPGWDIYCIHIYWKGQFLAKIQVDAIEVDCFRHGNSEESELDFREDIDFEKKTQSIMYLNAIAVPIWSTRTSMALFIVGVKGMNVI